MSKKSFLSSCMACAILILSNGNIVHAEENVGMSAEKIYEIHKEYVSSQFDDETDFAIESYGESGIDNRSARVALRPPECIHRSDLFEWNEYKAYTRNAIAHTYNTYWAYTYIGCGCSGTVQMTDNAWEQHTYYYIDRGHKEGNDKHYYDICCEVCHYLKGYRYYDNCPGLKTGQHIAP